MKNPLQRGIGFLRTRLEYARSLAGHRTLLWFRWRPIPDVPRSTKHSGVEVECLNLEAFRDLEWSGNRWVFDEACDWTGRGQRFALAAFTDERKLAGFCWLECGAADLRFFGLSMPLASGVGYLSRVWVDGEARGRGIGSALVAGLQREAMRMGLSEVIGACVPSNERMQSVFSNAGWLEYAAVHRYYVPMMSLFRFEASTRSTQRFAVTAAELGKLVCAPVDDRRAAAVQRE